MVFESIRKFIGGRRDPFDPRGLEQFTDIQQERILNRIATKEADILDRKAERLADQRIEKLERRSGLGERRSIGKLGLKEKLGQIKRFREGNLKRQAERSKKFEDNEKDFREGRLSVKPVGPKVSDPTQTPRIKVKPINLRAPSKSIF